MYTSWQDDIFKLKLFQKVRLNNITRAEFIQLFPDISACAVRVLKIKRTYTNHFNVDLVKDYICYRNCDLRLFLVQMGKEKVEKPRPLHSYTILEYKEK